MMERLDPFVVQLLKYEWQISADISIEEFKLQYPKIYIFMDYFDLNVIFRAFQCKCMCWRIRHGNQFL